MRILIIGASKGIGLEATHLALTAGYDVRALARTASAIKLHDVRLEKVPGDALNKQDVETALTGVDAVIVTLGVGLGELLKPVHLFSDATHVLIAAMKDKGVARQPPCPRATTILAGFEATEVGVSLGVLG